MVHTRICFYWTAVLVLALGVQTAHAGDKDTNLIERFSLGVWAGAGTVWFGGAEADTDSIASSRKPGIAAGLPVAFAFTDWLSGTSGMEVATSGARLEMVAGPGSGDLSMVYLQVPVIATLAPYRHRHIRPYLSTGPVLGFMLTCTLKFGDGGGDGSDCSDTTRALDVRWAAGAGIDVSLPWEGTVDVGVRYELGLVRLDDTDRQQDYRNRALFFTVGYQHNLGDLVDRVRGKSGRDTAGPAEAAESDQDSAEAPE
ncbi:outer membrane beta-barrel protein [Haliangium sp.]|uniref:outer membrane beta-barrel protein n=1 Tax=Haliangium sp. TaxID=2663208 RepID=UPI003D0DEA2F